MTPPRETAPADERPLPRLYAGLFLAAICLPFLRTQVGEAGAGAARELRRVEKRPGLGGSLSSWASFPRRFEDWYANEFGFREELMRQHNRAKWFGLATSPSEKVVRGRDDWVFYTENATLDQVRGAYPFEEAQLDDWLALLEERRAWLAERGCRYLFVIAPVKASIYPDYQPAGYERVGPSRLDQLYEALATRSEVPFLDLRPALVDERANDRGGDWTYYPLGTHWTRRGALRAWREIVQAVPEVLRVGPPPIEELERILYPDKPGDSWASRLYLEEHLEQEEWVLRLPPGPRETELPHSRQAALFEAADPEGLPRVILFHDSFGSFLRPLLARSCARLACFWRYAWELALIEEDRPALVVDLMVERTLVMLEPATMPLRTQESLRAGFEQAAQPVWSADAEQLAQRTWEAAAPSSGFRTLRLPDLEGEPGEICWIALDVESASGGLLEIALLDPGGGEKDAAIQRRRAARAFAGPGRRTLYFSRGVPARPRDLVLGSEQTGWTLHAAEVRRAQGGPTPGPTPGAER